MSQLQIVETSEERVQNLLRNRGQLNCPVCYYQFDSLKRVPMVLCSSQHNVCRRCLKQIKKNYTRSKRKCPLCKQQIKNDYLKKNRLLCQVIQVFTSLKLQQKKNQEIEDWESEATVSKHTQEEKHFLNYFYFDDNLFGMYRIQHQYQLLWDDLFYQQMIFIGQRVNFFNFLIFPDQVRQEREKLQRQRLQKQEQQLIKRQILQRNQKEKYDKQTKKVQKHQRKIELKFQRRNQKTMIKNQSKIYINKI